MDVRLINPFVNAVFSTLETMVGISPERDELYLKDNPLTQGDVTGIIGFAESGVFGSVALTFPTSTLLYIYGLMMNERVTKISREVQDLAGELTNIVAGVAKQELSKDGMNFHISIPTIVAGKNHSIRHQMNIPVLVVPMKLKDRPFILEVAIKQSIIKTPTD